MGERHVRIEISDFVMRTFVPRKKALNADAQSSNSNKNHEVTTAKAASSDFAFFHPDYTVGTGISPVPARLRSRTLPPIGNCTLP